MWIDLWAVWCGTCRAEFPEVQRLHERYERNGLTVLAVCRNSTREGFESAVRKDWLDFRVVDANEAEMFPFPYSAFPTSVVLDRAGRVRAYWMGHRSIDAVEELLRSLMAEDPSPDRPPDSVGDRLANPLAGPKSSRSVVSAVLELPRVAIAPGEMVDGRIVLDVDPGWHLVASGEAGSIPLTVRFETARPAIFDHLRPAPRDRELAGGVRSVYSGRVEIPIWGVIPADAPPFAPFAVGITTRVQACDDRSCLLPVDIRLEGEVWIDDSGERR